jgi:arylsulfatase A-like enzyme
MEDRMNVLLVVLDGARPDHFSCAGYRRETTPFLDRAASEGVRFEHAISTSPSSLAAHASLLTGLFAATHGATEESPLLGPQHRLLSEYLRGAGYRTAAFCTNPWVGPETGFRRGFDSFHTPRSARRFTGRATRYARKASDRVLGRVDSGARRTNRAVADWLNAGGAPFFAFVHYAETRPPFHPPAPFDRLFTPRQFSADRIEAVSQDAGAYMAGAETASAEDVAILNALYDGALRYADMRLRELADELARRRLWDDTLLVVTADHGQNLGEHGLLNHGLGLFDTALRVPLLVRCPGRVPAGFVVDELAQSTDVLPTILQLLGRPPDGARVQGRALLVDGSVTKGPGFAISEAFRPDLSALYGRFPDFDGRAYDMRRKAIRTRREKFVWRSDEANEFYDLVRDPGERHNSIESEPDSAERLRRRLFDWLSSVERTAARRPPAEAGEVGGRPGERPGSVE